MSRRGLAILGGAGFIAIFLALVPLVSWLNRPNLQRLETARQVLAEAGYPNARLSGSQQVSNMARCQVGQVFNKGRAYRWDTKAHGGVICLPEDGRPPRILLDTIRFK